MNNNLNDLSFDEISLLESLADIVSAEKTQTKKIILSPKDWLSSSYYAGDLSKYLYPFWRERVPDVFIGPETKYDEIVVTGGIGTGKSYFCCCAWMYMLYLLSMLKSPQEFLGLSPHSALYFVYLSVTKTAAKDTGFGELTQLLDSTPYFNKEFKRSDIDSVLKYPNNITFVCGSDVSHFIGKNMISMFFDEANFAKTSGGNMGDIKKAMSIYSNARTRVKSRFENERTKHFVLNMLVSSSTHSGSFTESIIKASVNDTTTKVISAPLYKVKPKGTYKDTNFLFFSGTEFHRPKVIKSKADLKNIIKDDDLANIGTWEKPGDLYEMIPALERFNFHLIPDNFKRDAEVIPEQVVQDVIGLSLATTDKLFKDTKAYEKMVLKGKEFGLRHPFRVEQVTLSRKDEMQLIDYLDVPYLKSIVGSNYCFMHIDQAETVCAASISLVFAIRYEGEDLCQFVIPLMIRIFPPKANEEDAISLDKLRKFVEDLRDVVGLNIAKVTFDQYQSSSNIELLGGKNFDVDRLSVDKTDEVYLEFSNNISRGRFIAYDYAPFKDELFKLIHDREKRKVMKPEKGSKDVADSVAGSSYNCMLVTDPQANYKKQDQIMKEIMVMVVKNEEENLNKKLFGEDYQVYDKNSTIFKQASRDINPWRPKKP